MARSSRPGLASPVRKIVLLLLAGCLLAGRAPAGSPVISSRWETTGFESVKPEDADFTVTVTYEVPGVVKDADTSGFRRFWTQVEESEDGDIRELVVAPQSIEGKCRDGLDGRWCNGSANVWAQNDGLKVTLDLSWAGKPPKQLKREFLVRWNELEKTIKDDEVEIHVAVRYRKK